MQVETELAVLYAASMYEADRTPWEEQAAASDKAIADLREAMDTIDTSRLDSSTRSSLDLIVRTEESPRRARSIVGGRVTDWPAALNVYSAISKSFVDASLDLANSTADPAVNAKARSWAMAQQIEADVAQQRAMLTGIFSNDSFFTGDSTADASTYDALEQAVESEENHSGTLEDFGESSIVKAIRDARAGNDVAAADDARQTALDGKDQPSLGISLEQWRIQSGKKLDRIHDAQVEVAESISESIADKGAEPSSGTDRDDRPFIAGALVLVLLALALGFFIGGRRAGGRRPVLPAGSD
jgi:hypothetical protein